MPSRKKIAIWIFVVFVLSFIGFVIWYVAPFFLSQETTGDNTPPARNVSLFPFGNDTVRPLDIVDNESNNQNIPDQTVRTSARMPQLRKISVGPVIAALMSPSDKHSGISGIASKEYMDSDVENVIRYIELGTGHVFTGLTTDPTITRISNTTIPKINQAFFVNVDDMVLRYIDDIGRIKTFSASLADNVTQSAVTEKKIQGIFLTDDIQHISVTPDEQLLYMVQNNAGDSLLIQSTTFGEDQKQIFSSPISEWQSAFRGNNTVLLNSIPSYDTYSVVYTVNATTGSSAPYTAARKALAVLPTDDLSTALISFNSDDGPQLSLWDRNTNAYTSLSNPTLVEKCIWAEQRARFYCAVPVGGIALAEPDLWYQGVSSYSDELWEINPKTRTARTILDIAEFDGASVDVIDLLISSDEQFLYFRDKQSRSLWSFQLDYDILSANKPALLSRPSRNDNDVSDTQNNNQNLFEQ